MQPHEWFGKFGASLRPLRTIAMRVLNMRVDQSQAERSFKPQGEIHKKKRNRLTFDNVVVSVVIGKSYFKMEMV